jgi:hypothetical protein
MAKITRTEFKTAKNTRYATNGAGAISATIVRAHEEDTADSVVFIDDDISTNSDFTVDGTKLTTRAAIKTLVDSSGGASALDDLTDVTITTPSGGDVLTYDNGTGEWVNAVPTGGGSSYWTAIPTITRISDTQFTIPDVGNAGNWDSKLGRLRVIKWTDTTTHVGIVTSSSYSSDVVTVNIAGDVLSGTATTTSFYYTIQEAKVVTFAIAGTMATGTDLSRKYFADTAYRVLLAKANHSVAGTTNATTYDLNKNGTTMFTTKLSVSSAATVGDDTTADDNTSLASTDYVTLDCDSVSTTAPIDVYVDIYLFPTNNLFL